MIPDDQLQLKVGDKPPCGTIYLEFYLNWPLKIQSLRYFSLTDLFSSFGAFTVSLTSLITLCCSLAISKSYSNYVAQKIIDKGTTT